MSLRDVLADTGYDVSKFQDDFAIVYFQDPANYSITDEGSGQGPPRKINDVVEIDPAQPDYGQAKSANGWRYGGDSNGGLRVNVGRETRILESDQHARAGEKHVRWTISVAGNLLQFEVEEGTLDNLLAILGGGTITDIPDSTPPQKKVVVPLGSEIEYRRAALVYPHEYNGTEDTICFVLRKGLLKSSGEINYQGRTQASIPFSMDGMPDDRDTVPTGEEVLKIIIAPGA